MAIFVAFAWVIEAAEYLGLIETEAQDPESRAYRLAHQGLELLKAELVGVALEVLGEYSVRKRTANGEFLIESRDGVVVSSLVDQPEDSDTIIDLGSGGGASFRRFGKGVEIRIQARTEDGGAYDVNLILPPVESVNSLS